MSTNKVSIFVFFVMTALLLQPMASAAVPAIVVSREAPGPESGLMSLPAPSSSAAPGSFFSTNCNPPASGDWAVSAPAQCVGETLTVKGNVIVTSKLELIDTTLIFNVSASGGYNLSAQTGSSLYINGSTLKTNTNDTFFSLLVGTGVTFSMNNSMVIGAGWKDLESLRGLGGAALQEYNNYFYMGAGFTVDLSFTQNDAIEIRSTPLKFKNNRFTNYTHIRFFSSNNIVDGNIFEEMKHEGLAFMTGSNNNVVTHNIFRNSTRMDREIFGLRFYTGCQYADISNNTFFQLVNSAMGANIPPWTSVEHFDVHHNTYTKVMFGFAANIGTPGSTTRHMTRS